MVLSAIWMPAIAVIGDEAYRFAWILPVAMLVKLLLDRWRKNANA
jgi:hypothetical protein